MSDKEAEKLMEELQELVAKRKQLLDKFFATLRDKYGNPVGLFHPERADVEFLQGPWEFTEHFGDYRLQPKDHDGFGAVYQIGTIRTLQNDKSYVSIISYLYTGGENEEEFNWIVIYDKNLGQLPKWAWLADAAEITASNETEEDEDE